MISHRADDRDLRLPAISHLEDLHDPGLLRPVDERGRRELPEPRTVATMPHRRMVMDVAGHPRDDIAMLQEQPYDGRPEHSRRGAARGVVVRERRRRVMRRNDHIAISRPR